MTVGLLCCLLAASVSGCGAADPDETARVEKGSVRASIDATGSLQYLTEQKLGFPQGGRLVSLKVAVGDHVVAGQELAAVDNTAQRVALRKAKNAVAKQQAILDRIIAGNQASGADDELGRVKDQVHQARRVLEETDEANRSEIKQAQRQLAFDQSDVQLKQDRFDQIKDQEPCPGGEPTMIPPPLTADPCAQYFSRLEALQDAKRRVVISRNDLKSARHQYEVDHEEEQADVDAIQTNETTARNKAELNESDRPFNIEVQQADLDNARAELELQQKAFDGTIMKSSFSGQVGKINGSVGQVLNAAAATPLFPGAPASDAAPVNAQAGSPAAAGDSFMVIKNVNAFQVSAPYSSIDAAKIEVGQPAEVTFDELPGLTRKATVSSVVPADPQVKDTNYIVKLALTESDPRMHDGMIAQAHVITSSTDNVLVVPTAAVDRKGQSGTVSMVALDGTRRTVPVELGAIGASTSQVISGLREGDQVAMPQGK